MHKRPYLTDTEIDRLIASARQQGRHGDRDALMILMAYRHGLRCLELCNLQWDAVMFDTARILVHRVKKGDSSVQPLSGEEVRALRKLRRSNADTAFVFTTERGSPLDTSGFRKIIYRAAEAAGLKDVHPHTLRHSCGYHLVNKGVDTRSIQGYLGHRNIVHTQLYTKLAADRFKDFGRLI